MRLTSHFNDIENKNKSPTVHAANRKVKRGRKNKVTIPGACFCDRERIFRCVFLVEGYKKSGEAGVRGLPIVDCDPGISVAYRKFSIRKLNLG
jgi:hypothetical protein